MKWLIAILFFMLSPLAKSQTINELKWKNRLVILNHSQADIDHLIKTYPDSSGIQERKLLFFQVKKDHLIPLNGSKKSKYLKPSNISEEFKFYLIGLDGFIKLKKRKALRQKELFEIIDSMPMRANEIIRKNE